MSDDNGEEIIDSPLLENFPRGTSNRLILADAFLNPQFKRMINMQIKELKDRILNLDDGDDATLGKEIRRYKQELFVWEQLAETVNVFAKDLPHMSNNKR